VKIEVKYSTIGRRSDLQLPGVAQSGDAAVAHVQVTGVLTRHLLATIIRLLRDGWKHISLELCDDSAREGSALISQVQEEIKRQDGTLKIRKRTDSRVPIVHARQSNGGSSGGSPAQAFVIPASSRRKRRH
jgi:hypothetical protein